MSMTYFAENLAYIQAVTEALNTLPHSADFYVHVELRAEGSHTKVGEWSDEIAPNAWYYKETTQGGDGT